MLTLNNIAVTQGDFTLSAGFTVNTGERVAIIGPSGGGKSTLLGAIAGFNAPHVGAVQWNGDDITHIAPGARPVSIIFQDNNLFPHLTIFQNVGLGIRPDLKLSTAQAKAVTDALRRVGLDGFAERKPKALSGGQIARVALARVAVQSRPLILLDEPFAALGPALKDEMLGLVTTLADDSGATVLMVSHDPSDARKVAGQTVLVLDGKAHAPQDTKQLFANPPAALRAYLGD